MRGVVSLAAALAIPITLDDGRAFPYRDLILFITFVTILLTLVVQGLTLPYFIKRSRLFDGIFMEKDEETEHDIKQRLRDHTYQFIKNKLEQEQHEHEGLKTILEHWKIKALRVHDDTISEITTKIQLELLTSQREYLIKLNEDPNVSEEIIRTQLYQIDLEEERLKLM